MAGPIVCDPQVPVSTPGVLCITPHSQYGSSIGALGCKIDVNRVAYWPLPVDCDEICVKISQGERSVHLLHVDESQGAWDISYDAYNYLLTGLSAAEEAITGGGVLMSYEFVHPQHCKQLLDDGKLPLSAANSMNYLSSCLTHCNTWTAANYVLYNIFDSQCASGVDEICDLNWPNENQADCAHGIGSQAQTTGLKVVNLEYGTGAEAP